MTQLGLDGKPQTVNLTKAKRRRIWRILKEGNWPIGHFSRDGMPELFKDEIEEMNQLRQKILDKAVAMGYDPEEDLVQ